MLTINKGYTITDLTRGRANKQGYFDPLAGVTDAERLRGRVLEVLDARGVAIRVTRKGKLVGVMLVERMEREAAELAVQYPELADRVLKSDDGEQGAAVKVLMRTERIVLPEYDAEIAAVEAGSDMRVELLNLLLDGQAAAVLWGGRAFARAKGSPSGFSLLGLLLGATIGFSMGLATKNVGIGLTFSVSMAMLWGVIFSRLGKGDA